MSFWCLTTLFNPANYRSLVDNYHVFAESLRHQKVNLLTLELAFGDSPHCLPGVRLRGDSVMWQKERLINHGISLLPPDCTSYAWLDADLIFPDDTWPQKAQKLLESYDVIQLFRRVFYLPNGDKTYQGRQSGELAGLAWQSQRRGWLEKRVEKDLPFAAPGFAWAARRDAFPHGIYDKDVVGSGDCVLADHLLGSWPLHGFDIKFNKRTKEDILRWSGRNKKLSVGYLPVDIFHLWHGDLRGRGYMRRHWILLNHDYDPVRDVVLKNGVWEWASDKPQLHAALKNYFYERGDDDKR